MAKAKANKAGSGIPHKPLHARISYLSQAAAYLASSEEKSRLLISANSGDRRARSDQIKKSSSIEYAQSRNLLSQLRAVSLKSQIRLTAELKHSSCKRCHSPLLPATASEIGITNKSRHAEKPWADILVVTCGFCSGVRRYPVGQKVGREKVVSSGKAQEEDDNSRHLRGKIRE